jgi:hypothetical protein
MNSSKADWFGWSTYFAFGFMVGIAVGYFRFIHCRFDYDHEHWLLGRIWLRDDEILPFVLGIGLLTGALSSQLKRFRRERGAYSHIIFPSRVKQSPASITCSLVIGIIGAGMTLYVVWRHVTYMGGLG